MAKPLNKAYEILGYNVGENEFFIPAIIKLAHMRNAYIDHFDAFPSRPVPAYSTM